MYLYTILLLSLALTCASGLRFSTPEVTVDTEVLIINRPSRLSCNYVKYRTESIREISWFAAYGGIRTKIFHYLVSTGEKEGSTYPFIETDKDSATDSELTVIMKEFRDANMTFGCEVESLRDNGYGKLRHNKKLGESAIQVINNMEHDLALKHAEPSATVGKPLVLTCTSRGATPSPQITIKVGGRNISEIYGGHILTIPTNYQGEQTVEAKLAEVTEELFANNRLSIECLAHFDDFLFDRKEIFLPKGVYDYRREQPIPQQEQDRRQLWQTDARHREQVAERRHDDNTHGRHGRMDEGYQADVIHSRLMDLVDPARHVHPGIPYDFFAGYLVLVTNTMEEDVSASLTLLGELPYDVKTALNRHYGLFNAITADRARMRMDPVKMLNMLGAMGYRVISSSKGRADDVVWTLERKNFQVPEHQKEL